MVELSGRLDAAEHRRRADGFAGEGRFAEAVRERMRAIVRELETRGVLEPRPGRTADEVAREAGALVPAVAPDLRTAATVFDEVWYGGRPAPRRRTRCSARPTSGSSALSWPWPDRRAGGSGLPGAAVSTAEADAVPDERAATVTGAGVRSLWRRYRVVVFVLLGILVVATGIGLAADRSVGGRLDPRSAEPTGSRALATLLGERGVRVERLTDPAGLAADPGRRTVILVAFPGAARSRRRCARWASWTSAPSCCVSPGDDVAGCRRRRDRPGPGAIPVRARSPGCSEPAADAAGDAVIGGSDVHHRRAGPAAIAATARTARWSPGGPGAVRELVVIGTGAVPDQRAARRRTATPRSRSTCSAGTAARTS